MRTRQVKDVDWVRGAADKDVLVVESSKRAVQERYTAFDDGLFNEALCQQSSEQVGQDVVATGKADDSRCQF